MLEIKEIELRKKLLKDYYKLKTKFINTKDKKTKLEILHDICSITEYLESNLIVYDDEYGYDYFYHQHFKMFKKIIENENREIEKIVETLCKNYDVYNEIYIANKNIIKKHERIKLDLSNSTEITSKTFYDLLFNIPFKELKAHLSFQLKNKSVFISNDKFLYGTKDVFGLHYSIQFLNKDYHWIETYNKYSYLTIISLIHELTHSYIENTYNCPTTLNVYREVAPYFYEYKTMDYFYKNNIGSLDILTNLNTILNAIKISTAGNFRLKSNEDYTYFMYLIGPLVAYYFYELCQTDEEKCNYCFDYFHQNIDKYEPLELLKKTNIELETFTSGEIAKRMVKQYDVYNQNYNQRTKI